MPMRAERLLAAVIAAALAAPALAVELRGHGGPVRAVAISPDGSRAITGSFDATAIIWAMETGTASRVLQFHDSQVNAVLVLGGGRYATAGQDGRIALWSEAGREPVRILSGHGGPVVALALSPDASRIASAAWDRTIRLWPLDGGEPQVLEGHGDNVNAVAFLPDGTLASGGYDATIRLWSAEGAALDTLALPSPVNALAALGDRLVAGSADGHVRLLARDGSILADRQLGPAPVIAVAVSPDGHHVAAAGIAGATSLLSARLAPEHALVGPGLPVWSLAFTPDGGTLVTGGSDRLVRSWDVATGEPAPDALMAAPPDPLAAWDGHRGAEIFRACVACHTLDAADPARAGPTLDGIFGRPIASVPGYPYSPAFRAMDIVWTPETVARLFEIGPHAMTPGTKMPEQVIADPDDRGALVEFLAEATGRP